MIPTVAVAQDSPLLAVRNVSKSFGGVVACHNINLDVAPGETVGILGPNGAGKSTLFDCISGYYSLDAGDIFLRSQRISRMGLDQITRLGVGRTFQAMRLFHQMTVAENVMVGAFVHVSGMREAREYALEVVEYVGLTEKCDAIASSLSTGQRKRLELARALATKPALLLLDEVTGGVDPTVMPGLLDLIQRLQASGLALLIVEHNMQVIRALCNRLLALHLGEVIADGPADVVVRDERVIGAYLGHSYAQHS